MPWGRQGVFIWVFPTLLLFRLSIQLFVMMFRCPYFAPKSFCLVRTCYKLLEFSFVVLESPILSVLFGPVSVFFSFLYFTSTFWLVSSCCIFFFSSCRAFSVSSEYIFLLGCSIFAYCRSFSFCDSNLSSHQDFDFLSMVFRATQIFSQTNFTPAFIKSFNSVMLFVGIFANKTFTFSV